MLGVLQEHAHEQAGDAETHRGCARALARTERRAAGAGAGALPAAASTSHAEGARADAAASPAAAAAGDVPGDEGGAAQPAKQANKNRCYSCNKRVGFTGFECRCGFVYCATHRHANKHACSFDFKAMGRDAVAKANPR